MSKYARFSIKSTAYELGIPWPKLEAATSVLTIEWTRGSSTQIALTIDKYGNEIPAWMCGADGDDISLEDYLERVHHLKSISWMNTLVSNGAIITEAKYKIIFTKNRGVLVLTPSKTKARLIKNKR